VSTPDEGAVYFYGGREMTDYTVEFVKKSYQYVTVEASSESEAIRRARALLKENKWDDYGNGVEAFITGNKEAL
jgi:hypothetical protein